MSTYPHELVRRLFEEALDRPEAERIPFLEAACAKNPEVFRQVKALLEARAEAGDFLQREPERPRRIGRYVVTGELGRGAMGIVYEAVDPLIERTVAIKIIHLQPLAGAVDTSFLRDRLFREARSAGMLFHPNIAVILDVGQEGDVSFIAMERVDGPSLYKVLEADHKMDRAKAVSIVRQTGAALDFAHGKGVVHRDIKPANIMLEKGVTVKVADFGIAKITSAQQQTQTGFPMGTPSYMSPEQVDAKPLDGRSDQFSLAVVAYELLTGTKPFQSDTVTGLMHSIAYSPRPSARAANPELPVGVDGVFQRALARLPAERYANCGEFVEALEKALAGEVAGLEAPRPEAPRAEVMRPPARRRWVIGLAGAAVLMLLVAAALGYHFWPRAARKPGPTVAPSVPVITRFTADHAAIEPGASATLSWETSGASTLTIEPGVGKVPAQGPVIVRPSKTTTYLLTATNAAGQNSAETTVEVSAPTPAPRPDARQIYADAQAKRRAGQSAQALALLRQAAELGETRAMMELGDYYLEDVNDEPRDAAEAVRWFRKAAGAGDASGMLQVGACYDLGSGVPQDDGLAASWYRKAADRGSSAGAFDLGKMYESGRGVPKDRGKACDLYRRAGGAGNAEAIARLVQLCAR